MTNLKAYPGESPANTSTLSLPFLRRFHIHSRDTHFLLALPVSITFTPSLDQTNKVKRINESPQEISFDLITRPLDLRDSILGQIDLVTAGQKHCRVSRVEEKAVDDHEQGLKDPEEPLVTNDGRNRHGVEAWRDTDLGNGKIFHGAVDGADGDERAAAVQRDEHGLQVVREQVGFIAFLVEVCGQEDEAQEDTELED